MTIILLAFAFLTILAVDFHRRLHTDRLVAVHYMADEDEDADIKIAGGSFKSEPGSASKQADRELEEEIRRQKELGNIEKAYQLGALLAQEVAASDGEFVFGEDESEDMNLFIQRRLLLSFTVCHGLDLYTRSWLVATTALNQFYDTLKKENNFLYDDLSKSGEISFYYLCVRKGRNVSNAIGKTFARLCKKESSTVYQELGEALYLRFLDVVEDACEKLGLR